MAVCVHIYSICPSSVTLSSFLRCCSEMDWNIRMMMDRLEAHWMSLHHVGLQFGEVWCSNSGETFAHFFVKKWQK